MMFVYFSEIFPTSVKAIGILITYASGSIGEKSEFMIIFLKYLNIFDS